MLLKDYVYMMEVLLYFIPVFCFLLFTIDSILYLLLIGMMITLGMKERICILENYTCKHYVCPEVMPAGRHAGKKRNWLRNSYGVNDVHSSCLKRWVVSSQCRQRR